MEQVKPAPQPWQIIRLVGQEALERLLLMAGVVVVARLQPVRRVLETVE
jgi:hypothetical protein